ncbi:MAG: sialidase family protein, partial [Gemmatimonadota bacterium]
MSTDSTCAVRYRTVGSEPPAERVRACRATLAGPGHNEPEPYEGYGGFVGWCGITLLRSGRWLCTFTSGLWHATFPWTPEIARDPECRRQFEEWAALGLPDRPAPRGGRAHVMHSDDEGATWSRPRTLVDTDRDDRHPTILEMADGSLLCTWFASRYPRDTQALHMRSTDGGATWTAPQHPAGDPQDGGFGNGSAIPLADGTVLWAIGGGFGDASRPGRVRLFRSRDQGATFELLSTLTADHDLDEPTLAELPGGRLALAARREGDMSWSDDGGKTWMPSATTGWGLYDPHLLALPSGVLA